jgi:hypothetical protein
MPNLNPPMTDLAIRSWNNTPISRRTTDGYVNATAMAKANGKEWAHYFRTDRATTYLEALSRNCEIAVTDLYIAKQGEGTWIHPRVAIDFARWISPEFAVWMDGWFLEELEGRVSQVRDTQPPALPGDVLSMVDRSINLLERLGGVDDRAQMLLRDVVLNATLSVAGGSAPQLGPAKELTVSEFLVELGCPAHKATKVATAIGKEVKRTYHGQNGRDPKTQPQLVGGRRCDVALYERDWLLENEADFRDAIEQLANGG